MSKLKEDDKKQDTPERLAQLWKFGVGYNGTVKFSNGVLADVQMKVPHGIYNNKSNEATVILVDNLRVKRFQATEKIPIVHSTGEFCQYEQNKWEKLENSSFLGNMIYEICNDFYIFEQVFTLQVDRRNLSGGFANKNEVTDAGISAITTIFATGTGRIANISKGSAITKGRVFWSSGGNPAVMKAAMEFAKKNGAQTLEMTMKGKALTQITKMTSFDFTKPFWEQASKSFAKGATGSVHSFQNLGGINMRSIWGTVEYPILKQNGVEVIYIIIP